MKLVLAYIDEQALIETETKLNSTPAEVLATVTDVSKIGAINALIQKTPDPLRTVKILCNNAGCGGGLPKWELMGKSVV
jgi:NADP-dependent 3-hydroxy acid dehydrogenase YdfG